MQFAQIANFGQIGMEEEIILLYHWIIGVKYDRMHVNYCQ